MIKVGKTFKNLSLLETPTNILLKILRKIKQFGKNGLISKDLSLKNFQKAMES